MLSAASGRRPCLELHKMIAMFIEHRLEKLIKRITAGLSIPLRLVLWNGREFSLAS